MKNGEIPAGSLVLRSLADILNLLTFNLLHGVLDPVRLEPHARQKLLVRSYSSETVNGVRQESERTLNSDEERIKRYQPGEDSPQHILSRARKKYSRTIRKCATLRMFRRRPTRLPRAPA